MRNTLTLHAELNHFDEQELIARVQNGDTEAFNPLVYKYQQKIYNLIYRKVRDRETAEDLCQEVFLKAWQALPNFNGQSVFYTWLYQIAFNCSIDYIRKRDREIIFACEELHFCVRGITTKRRRWSPDAPNAAITLSNP